MTYDRIVLDDDFMGYEAVVAYFEVLSR